MLNRIFGNSEPDPTVPPLRITGLAPNATPVRALVRRGSTTLSLPVVAWAAVAWATMDSVEGIVLDDGQATLASIAGDQFIRYEETEPDHF